MADVFDFYVYDDRSIRFEIAEPIMLEDKAVTEFRFRIPKSLNGFDMSDWEWRFIFVNPKGTKNAILLELTDDEDEPEEYSIATYTLGYEFTDTIGTVKFAIEVLNMQDNEIVNEWHTRTYSTVVTDTLQGESSISSRFRITYNLADNIASSNTKTKIADGESYATTISSTNTDYQINTITVTMGGTDITATAVSDNEISISSVTGDITITVSALYYPSVETDASTLTITSGSTGTLKVKLHAQPTQSQTVTLHSDALTLSESSLTFTTSNWDTWQSVTVTAPSVETTEYAYINLTNSDPLMTESTVMVTVKEMGYEDLVDTTIPTTGQHVLTADDFTSASNYTMDGKSYIRLYGYKGEYTNVVMPAEMDGHPTLTLASSGTPSAGNTTFATNTTIQYVTFEDGCRTGDGGAPANNTGQNMFVGCTALIGVSNVPTSVVSLSNAFNRCTSLNFVDNLDELINVTSMYQAFQSSGIQYVQDLSALTSLTNVQTMFKQSGLVKIFGMPELNTTSANGVNMYANCTSLTYGIVPKGVNNIQYAFYGDTALRRVDIYADDIPSSGITNTTFGSCRNLKVYCNAGTTTEESLLSAYGSSTNVTILNFGKTSSTPSIVVWGDSISSQNKAWIEWPARLQTKLGTANYLVKNEALAGEWSTSTTARQGGYAMTASAFTIPADTTATEITFSTVTLKGTETFTPLAVGPIFSAGASFNPCTIAGVKGTITKDSSKYYFTRLESGTAVNVSAGTAITSDNDTAFNSTDNVMIFYLNGNAGWDDDADKLLEMCQNAVNHFTTLGGTKYIIAGPAANVILERSDLKTQVIEFEGKAETAFGSHWLNLREYEIQNGLSQNNLTASALDTERMAQGLVPASLVGGGSTTNIIMYDGVNNTDQNHPNVYGANTIMLAFYEKGVALGYWT